LVENVNDLKKKKVCIDVYHVDEHLDKFSNEKWNCLMTFVRNIINNYKFSIYNIQSKILYYNIELGT